MQFNVEYLLLEMQNFRVDDELNMEPVENHLKDIKDAFGAFQMKASQQGLTSFKDEKKYVQSIEDFLKLPEIIKHEATAQDLVRGKNARRREHMRLAVEEEAETFRLAYKEYKKQES